MISFWWNTAKYFSSDMNFYPSKIEPNRKILSSKDAHGYCASFSLLIKKLFKKTSQQIKQISQKVIYNIGTKFLCPQCFGTSGPLRAPFSILTDDPESSHRDASFEHGFKPIWTMFKTTKFLFNSSQNQE